MANYLAPSPKSSFLKSLYDTLAQTAARGKTLTSEDLASYMDAIKKHLSDTAENLPTTEENINALRRGASNVYDKLSEGAGAVAGGLGRMADMATREGAGVRDQIMQRYGQLTKPTIPQAQNPMGGYRGPYDAPEPEVSLYMAPDGSGQMWPREKIEAYYVALQDAYGQSTGAAPSRAAFRRRQQR
jgi:hypothetical protein